MVYSVWVSGAFMAEEWSYHRLCDVYREEKSTNFLTPMPADFHRSLQELISRLTIASSGNPDGQKELDNARKQIRLLVRIRRQKLMMRASMEFADADPQGMTSSENALYLRLREMYKQEDEQLESLMHPLPSSSMPLSAMPAGGMASKIETNGGTNGGAQNTAPALRKIKLLNDVPEYRGADGQTYGPYSSNQSVELPESEAKALLSGSMACEIGPNGENVVYVTQAVKILKVYMEMDTPAYEGPDGKTYGPFKKGERVMLPEPEARHLIRLKLGMESD